MSYVTKQQSSVIYLDLWYKDSFQPGAKQSSWPCNDEGGLTKHVATFWGVGNLARPKELQQVQLRYAGFPVWIQYAHGSNYSGYHHSQAEQEHCSPVLCYTAQKKPVC